jgi:hypothetical protein
MKNLIIFFLLCFTTQLFAQPIGFTPNMLYKSGIKVDTVIIRDTVIYCPPKVKMQKPFIEPIPCTFTSTPIAKKDTIIPMNIKQMVNIIVENHQPEPTMIIVKDKALYGFGWLGTGVLGLISSAGCFAIASSYDVHIARLQTANQVWVNGKLIISQTTGTDNVKQEMNDLLHHKQNWQMGGCIAGGMSLVFVTVGSIQLYNSAASIGARINF